jgi:hypothetical protein
LAGMVSTVPKDPNLPILQHAATGNDVLVDIAGALFVLLCHPQRRGGGDIPANALEMGGIDAERGRYATLFRGVDDLKGRWCGGHILGTGEIRYEDWPTTEEVSERGTDISEEALRYLVAITHYQARRPVCCAQAGLGASSHQPKEVPMPRQRAKIIKYPSEVTIEYLIPLYIEGDGARITKIERLSNEAAAIRHQRHAL